MISRIYIIGKINDANSINTQNRFSAAQTRLEKNNMRAFNPLNTFLMYPESREIAIKRNLQCLINSYAVYVLRDSDHNAENHIEIMLAIKLNILIIHEY